MTAGRRGATRSQTARAAILAAASSLVERLGYDRVTMEGIASEAGVGKQTIYRWWPSKSAVVAECLVEGALLPEAYVPHDTGDIVADLTEWLQRVFDFIAAPRHETMLRSLIAAAVDNPEIGEQYGIGARTVATHVEHVLAKTGCRNRVEAACHGARLGIALCR